MPDDEPRAEIIEVSGEPLGWSGERPLAGSGSRGDEHDPVGGIPVGRGRRTSLILLAAAGVAVAIALAIGLPDLARRSASSAPALESSAGPSAAAASPGSGFADMVGALYVISVEAANSEAGDPNVGEAELAVAGWYTSKIASATCLDGLQSPQPCASDPSRILEAAPDTIWTPDGSLVPNAGNATLTPVFLRPVNEPDLGAANPGADNAIVEPSPIILIGHFHDDREQVGRAFVVDGVADQGGTLSSNSGGQSTQLTVSTVGQLVASHVRPTGYLLSFGALGWLASPNVPQVDPVQAEDVPPVEPSPDGPPADGRTVWLARGYLTDTGGPTAAWLAIDDATGQIWGPLAIPRAGVALPRGIPDTVDGLPVETVGTALPTSAAPPGLLAIGGYLSNDRAAEGCSPTPTTDKPDPCTGTELVLADSPLPVLQADDATFLYAIAVPPGVASFQPVVLPGTSVADPWAQAGLAARLAPMPVVLIGRFGDPRSPECAARPGGGSAACDRSFVVDQIAWSGGVKQGSAVLVAPGAQPVSSTRAVLGAAARSDSGDPPAVYSITCTRPADSPDLSGVTFNGQADQLFWVVQIIRQPRDQPASSFLVLADGSLAVVAIGP